MKRAVLGVAVQTPTGLGWLEIAGIVRVLSVQVSTTHENSGRQIDDSTYNRTGEDAERRLGLWSGRLDLVF